MEYINLNHLKYFYCVAQYESVTQAAEHLHIQQPALSKTIRSLEKSLGYKVLQKKGRGVELTEEGRFIYAHCFKIFKDLQRIQSYSAGEILEIEKTKYFFTNDAIASHLLPHLLSLFRKESSTRPIITTGPTSDLIKKMESKPESIGFFFHTPKLSQKLEIFDQKKIDFKLVVKKGFEESESILSSFIGSREIDNQSNTKFPALDELRKKYPQTKIKLSANSLMAHKNYVLEGLGVSILPLFLIEKEIRNKKLSVLLPEKSFSFHLKAVRNSRSKKNEIQSFLAQKIFELM